jgi:hypothetical protein
MHNKTVISGKYVEISSYSRPVGYDFTVPAGVIERRRHKKALVRRADNVQRAKKRVLRLTMANELRHAPVFITMTYRNTMLDRSVAVRDVSRFVRCLRSSFPLAKYIYTLERQKTRGEREGNAGTWHVHMLIFNVPFISYKVYNRWWNSGNTKIMKTNDALHCGFYLGKYIGKDIDDLAGNKRAYSAAHGLEKPQAFRYIVAAIVGKTLELKSETIRSNVLGTLVLTRSYYAEEKG